jgi:hypothetical protein
VSGRTTWLAKDAAWHRRGYVVELGEEHGPAGPLVLDYLACEAKAQGPVKGHDGSVKAGYAAVARACFITADQARAIVATAAEVGALDDLDDAGRTFTCRISGWTEDVEKPLAATRRATQRAAGDIGRHEATDEQVSPDVAKCPPTGEGQEKDTSSLRSEDAPARADEPTKTTRRKPAPPPPDEWPAELPTERVSLAEYVFTVAQRVAVAKGSTRPPTMASVGRALVALDRKPWRKVADAYEHWAVHGNGSGKPVKDPVQAMRNWADGEPDVPAGATVHPLPGAGRGMAADPQVAALLGRRPDGAA